MDVINDLIHRSNYAGYKGINLDNFNIGKLNGLVNFVRNYINQDYINSCTLDNLETISLDDVRKMSRDALNKYFSINNIDTLDYYYVTSGNVNIKVFTDIEFYDEVNKLLVSKSPYDLDVKIIDGHSMIGEAVKPLIVTSKVDTPNRKVYFSHINLGNQLTKISVATLAHEIAHTQQEKNIGYADDFLHKEVISIFVEKLIAYELDPTCNLLKNSEKIRFSEMLAQYSKLKNGKLLNDEKIINLMYIKSALLASKLFDIYINERKQKNKDKIIDDIQKVFDGKITVEELLGSRYITLNKCQDIMLLKRRSWR